MTQVILKWFKQTELWIIPSDWDIHELETHLKIKWRIWWKWLKKSEYLDKWFAIINGLNLVNWEVTWHNVWRIPKDRYDESPEIMLKDNDILMSKDWTIWKLWYIKKLPEAATVASWIFVIRNKSNLLNQDYLYYYFKSPYFKQLVNSRIEWAVIPHLYQRDLNKLQIPLPDNQLEQKTIAEILSSLDDKIKLLEKQNKTLENIGQAIFKSWFVDFEGFKNDLVESEMGMIPRGWDIGKLKDVSIIQNGYAFKSWDYVNEWNIIIRTKNFSDSWYVEMKGLVYLNDIKANEYKKFRFELFDFLLVMVWASIWKNVIITQINIPSLQNQNMWNFKPLNEEERFYNIFVIKQLIKQNIWAVSWSARDFFRKDQFYNFDIVIPSKDIVIKFDTIIRPNYEKISLNLLEIQTLSNLRDSLLPRLMNGKVRV